MKGKTLKNQTHTIQFLSAVLALSASGFTAAGTAEAATEFAKINGKSITDKELTRALSGMNEGQKSLVMKDKATRRQLVNQLVDQEAVVQEGEKLKIDQSQEYKDALENFRRQYLATQVLEKSLGPKLTESSAKQYFEANKRRFSTDEVHVQHILLADELEARDVLKKAQAPDADFQALAEKLSKDPSAKNNRGDIGVVLRDSPFVEEFKEAAFNGEEGKIVGPVKTSFGYHLIKIVQKKTGRPMNYDEVELRVKAELRENLVKAFVLKLRAQAKVTLNDKAIDKI